ncbi:MAG TPA: HAMP domain-containing sensor histidine kinase [Candidatus Limnocylindria bacterium]|nr:HAMP domain-containing sensor histidine kinase [Candidatus Limnocylindria bacterium]
MSVSGIAVVVIALTSNDAVSVRPALIPALLCGLAVALIGAGRIAIPAVLAFLAAMAAVLVTGDRLLDFGLLSDTPVRSMRASVLLPTAITSAGLGILLFPLFTAGTALCGACTATIGILCLALASDSVGLAQAMGIRPEHVTPLPAALLPLVLGIGVLATHRLRPQPPRSLGYSWAPAAATLLLVTMAIVLWQGLVRLQVRDLAQLTRSASATLGVKLLSEIDAVGSILDLLSRQRPDPARAWTQEARVLRRTSPAVVALSFRDGHLRLVQEIALASTFAVPSDLPPDDRELLAASLRGEHEPVVTAVDHRVEGHPLVRIALARDPGVQEAGYVMAALDVGMLLDDQATAFQDYTVRIEAAGVPFVERGAAGTSWDDPATHRQTLALPGGTQWTLVLSPSRALRRSARSVMPDIVLGATLLLAVLLGSTLRLARSAAAQAIVVAAEAEQRRRAESVVRALAADLENRVQQRTEELQRANDHLAAENAMRQQAEDRLRRSNEDLRQFAAFVAHELRQPLSTMGLWAELLEAGPPALTDKQRRHLDKIRAAVARMSRLIESELALAQISDGELPKEPVDLSSLVADVRTDMAPALSQAGARLDTGALPTVTADPRQLRLLFRNLVENALKHRGDEPLVVRIEEAPPDDPTQCAIMVKDNSRGLTTEAARRMFTIFERQTNGVVPSTGIGLAICRRIVEQHGGRLTAHAHPETGATFLIELPRDGGQPAASAAAL